MQCLRSSQNLALHSASQEAARERLERAGSQPVNGDNGRLKEGSQSTDRAHSRIGMKTIDWTKWSAIAEILGAIAIVATLVYLAVQTQYLADQTELLAEQSRQNTAAVQASTRQAMLAEDRELLTLAFESPEVFEIMTREVGSLTDAERIRMMAWLVVFIRGRENQWLQYQNGVIDEATWTTYGNAIAPILSFEITRPWWVARSATGEWDPRFVAYVNEVLARTEIVRPTVPELTDFE